MENHADGIAVSGSYAVWIIVCFHKVRIVRTRSSAARNVQRSCADVEKGKRLPRHSAEHIARLAEKGKDVSRFFTNFGRMMGPIQRVNVDFAAPRLDEVDNAAKELNISRQAVIKTLIQASA